MAWENFPYSYTSPHIHLWSFEALQVIIFWVRVTHKMLNVNWGKNSLNNFISHLSWLLRNFPLTHTHPLKTSHEFFETLWVIIFWVRATCKMLNVNWEKIQSIILSVTCHGLRNFAPAHTHPPQNHSWIFQDPMSYYFLSVESLIKCWIWIV